MTQPPAPAPVLVAGIGSPAGDDGVGWEVAGQVAARLNRMPPVGVEVVERAQPAALLDLMAGRTGVVLIDAVRTSGPPGTLVGRELGAGRAGLDLPAGGPTSTHGWGLGEALELARALERLPPRVRLVGIAAGSFEPGAALSPPVAEAVPVAVTTVLDLVAELVAH